MIPRMVWASLVARRARLALAATAVMMGVAVTTALATLALQVGDDLARTLRAAGPNFVVLPEGASLPIDVGGVEVEPPRAGFRLSDSAAVLVKSGFWKNHVLEGAPELSIAARIDGQAVRLDGTWFDYTLDVDGGPWRTGVARLHPTWTLEGRWPREDADEVALGHDIATRLGKSPGQSVTITSVEGAGRWRVTGIVTASGPEDARAWTSLSRAQALANRPGEIDRLWLSALVKPAPHRAPPDPARDSKGYERYMCTPYPANVAADLRKSVHHAEVLPMTELVAGEGAVVNRLDLLMLLLALAALTASVLGVFSTTTATVVERLQELGLLRSLGASAGQITTLLLGETLLVSLIGGALGYAIGVAAAAAIRGTTFGSVAEIPVLLLPVALVLSLLLGLVGTLGPLRFALRIDPARVLRA